MTPNRARPIELRWAPIQARTNDSTMTPTLQRSTRATWRRRMLKLSKSLGGIQFRLICPEGVVLLFRVNGRPDVCGPAGGVAGRLERPDLRALPCPAPDADPVPAALDAVAIGVTRPDIEADLGILVDQ